MSKQFVPPGYVTNIQVIEALANHLFPQPTDEPRLAETKTQEPPVLSEGRDYADPFAAVVKEGLKSSPLRAAPLYSAFKHQRSMVSAEEEEKLLEVLHALRALLYEQKLIAFYADTLFGGGIRSVPQNFWLNDFADQCIACGVFAPLGPDKTFLGETPLFSMFFKAGDLEAALSPNTPGPIEAPQQGGGRPLMLPEVFSAYKMLYPNGHVALRHTWKQARLAVEDKIGKKISMTTLKRAVPKGIQK